MEMTREVYILEVAIVRCFSVFFFNVVDTKSDPMQPRTWISITLSFMTCRRADQPADEAAKDP